MNFKLGKLPPLVDRRTIHLLEILKGNKLPPFPSTFTGPAYPLQMWGNDRLGDCVLCGCANYQTRAEMFEQKAVIPITEAQIIHEYFWLTGGLDSGLDMLSTVKFWRKYGLFLAKKQYFSFAFASVKDDPDHLKAVTSLIGDAWCGFSMPDSWQKQIDAGHIWDDISLPPNQDNGHCMAIGDYDKDGANLKTWGQKQRATWAWVMKYSDERYAILDAPDKWVKSSPVDDKALSAILKEITT